MISWLLKRVLHWHILWCHLLGQWTTDSLRSYWYFQSCFLIKEKGQHTWMAALCQEVNLQSWPASAASIGLLKQQKGKKDWVVSSSYVTVSSWASDVHILYLRVRHIVLISHLFIVTTEFWRPELLSLGIPFTANLLTRCGNCYGTRGHCPYFNRSLCGSTQHMLRLFWFHSH
jgi:hypothetical protein